MRHRALIATLLIGAVAVAAVPLAASGSPQDAQHPEIRLFFDAAMSADRGQANDALKQIEKQWRPGYAPMLLEFVRFMRRGAGAEAEGFRGNGERLTDPDNLGGDNSRDGIDTDRFASRRDPRVQARERVMSFIQDRTGQKFGDDLNAWRKWIWSQPYDPHPGYGALKANLYGSIDERFRNFFRGESTVRLDEIDWGGVKVSGIPALDHPATLAASQASYLADSDVVFGVSVNGEHRAYPRRILAWHELAWDKVGDAELTVVYCTLCGTVIPYKSEVGGRLVKFDTSGLLYRSNKLLYDDVSWTLWSSISGEPVAGPMVGTGLRLTPLAAVTTTWGEWRALHPDTTVLSLDTGFKRDYSEGAAYAGYFATDDLMFEVAETDSRLPNKAEVLAIRFPSPDGDRALAITAEHLQRNPVFQANFAGRDIVVVTSPDGANRVYAASGYRFERTNADGKLVDSTGGTWRATEDLLIPDADPSAGLPRLTAFRAFWFGWYAQYPDTELIGA